MVVYLTRYLMSKYREELGPNIGYSQARFRLGAMGCSNIDLKNVELIDKKGSHRCLLCPEFSLFSAKTTLHEIENRTRFCLRVLMLNSASSSVRTESIFGEPRSTFRPVSLVV